MKIQYISDIHLELLFKNSIKMVKYLIQPEAEICVLAGDIGNPYDKSYEDFLLDINSKFKKTFIIAGNHEYYKNDIIDTKEKIKSVCDNFKNITFLDNSYEDYEGYRFVGTTLWTDIKNKQYTINDTKMIKNLSIDYYNLLHSECSNFLNETLTNCTTNNIKSILITHHLPIYELTHPKYRDSFYTNYQQWFHANLDNIIKSNNLIISACIYGHTHSESVQNHYDVNFYCNPVGYAGENNPVNINKVFEL
jgi:predicted phosphodiesterase